VTDFFAPNSIKMLSRANISGVAIVCTNSSTAALRGLSMISYPVENNQATLDFRKANSLVLNDRPVTIT
jgi:hypothetical protein